MRVRRGMIAAVLTVIALLAIAPAALASSPPQPVTSAQPTAGATIPAPTFSANAVAPSSSAKPAAAAPKKDPSTWERANWTKYLALLLAALGLGHLAMSGASYLLQSRGFRQTED